MTEGIINVSGILSSEINLLSKMEARASELEEQAKELAKTGDTFRALDVLNNTAGILALEEITSVAKEIVIAETLKAVAETKEYDYAPYVERLMNALEKHMDEIITITSSLPFTFNTRTVRVSFESLGDINEWIAAAKNARVAMNMGKTRKWDIGMASHMWAEKIYGTGREGKQLPPRKRKKKGGKKGETELVDVTERYRGKYLETILTRLSFVSQDKAPFWWLIDRGNASGGGRGEGEPYPAIAPTRFVHGIYLKLKEMYESVLVTYKEEAKRLLDKYFQLEEEAAKKAEEIMVKLTEGISTGETDISKFNREALEVVKGIEYTHEIYGTGRGNVKRRVRNAKGQWTKIQNILETR